MRISDWSSDVCSSDLPLSHAPSRPDHATDHVDERRIDVLPNRIIGVITANREFALYKSQRHSLHHQRVVHAQHINRSEEHTSELQSLMRISYAVFCLKKKKKETHNKHTHITTEHTDNK